MKSHLNTDVRVKLKKFFFFQLKDLQQQPAAAFCCLEDEHFGFSFNCVFCKFVLLLL